jgi:hypothetical protein
LRPGDRRHLAGGEDKEPGNHEGFGHAARSACSGLKGLSGRLGKDVEVEAVIPVCAADERESVGAEAIEGVLEAALEVVGEGLFCARPVLVDDRFVEDAPVTGLFQIGGDAEDEPSGSSLKPPPIRSLPRLVSGWY